MPAIKKSDVLEDSVKKAFDDLNGSVKLSVDLLVMMTKSAKDINASLGNGSNISQVAAAQSKYSEQLERQIKHETDLVRLDRQRLALSEAKRKADEAKANSAIAANDKQAKSAANLAAINARAAAAQTRADDARLTLQSQQMTDNYNPLPTLPPQTHEPPPHKHAQTRQPHPQPPPHNVNKHNKQRQLGKQQQQQLGMALFTHKNKRD